MNSPSLPPKIKQGHLESWGNSFRACGCAEDQLQHAALLLLVRRFLTGTGLRGVQSCCSFNILLCMNILIFFFFLCNVRENIACMDFLKYFYLAETLVLIL